MTLPVGVQAAVVLKSAQAAPKVLMDNVLQTELQAGQLGNLTTLTVSNVRGHTRFHWEL